MTLLALFFLSAWVLVSVLCHLYPLAGRRLQSLLCWLGQRDPLQLLTTWNLFAPVPVGGDCRLLIRDRLSSGKQTRWREVSLIRDRRPLHVLWNPDLLPATTAYRYMLTLATRREEPAEVRGQSVPYLAVLRYVRHLPRSEEAAARQFLFVHTSPKHPDTAPEPIFLSGFHELR